MMIGRLFAIVLLAAAPLTAQPIVFGAPQRIPMTAFGWPPPGGSSPWLTGTGDGFFALYSTAMIALDDGGRTLRGALLPNAVDIAAVVPCGPDVFIGRRTEPSHVVDMKTLTARDVPIALFDSTAVASNGSTIVAVGQNTRTTVWDRNGSVVSAAKVLLVPAPQGRGAIATNGGDYVAVWNDGVILRTITIAASGAVRWNNDFWILDIPASPAAAPLIAAGGGKYLIVWPDAKNLYARLAAADGRGDGDALALASDSSTPAAVAWDGHSFLVKFGSQIARVGIDGKRLDPPPANDAEPPIEAIAANGRAAVAVRKETCACAPCTTMRIGPLGGVSSVPLGAPEITGPIIHSTAIAATEETAVVAYRDEGFLRRVRIAFIPSRGPSITVPSSTGLQSLPAIATDGTSFLVVWNDRNPRCKRQVRAAIMDANGRFSAPVWLSAEEEVAGSAPAVTWNGSEYAVVWKHGWKTQLGGIRVTRTGTPIGPPTNVTALLGSEVMDPSIAWTGGGYVVGFRQAFTYLIARLDPVLRPVASEAVLGSAQYGNVAWNGSEAAAFLRFDGDLKLVRIDAHGNAVSMKSVAISPPTFDEPSVASRNGEWLVSGTDSSGGRIARITPAGDVVGVTELLDGADRVELWVAKIAATPSRVFVAGETWNKPWTIVTRASVPPRVRAMR